MGTGSRPSRPTSMADGKIDIYVANDRDAHFLYLNNGDGTFRDVSEDSGAAFDIEGQAQAGMGVDAEDVDGDGRPELFVTNFADEYDTLYRNLGRGYFLDATANFGLAVDSIPWIGWGCVLADLDNDGWPDIVVANANIDDNAESLGKPLSYGEPRSYTGTSAAGVSAWLPRVPGPISKAVTWATAWLSETSMTTATSIW